MATKVIDGVNNKVYGSKHYPDYQIKCRLSDGSLYLKEGVRKRPMSIFDETEDNASHINTSAIMAEKMLKAMKILNEERDFSGNS